MDKKKVTVKDLAKIMGVSVSTISKALNDSYEISEKTKARVRKYARKHNYKPNKLAVNLKSGKTKNIGVIIPNVLNTFFTRVLYGIERITAEENYNIITCFSRESYDKEVANIELLSNGSIDGFIVAMAGESQVKGDFKHLSETISDGNPIVLFDRIVEGIDCDKVLVDDFNNAYYATKHLIHKNCKRIAMVSTINLLSVGKLRVDGYKQAIQESPNDFDDKLIITANSDMIESEIGSLLQNEKVDGIFAVNEEASLAVSKIVKEKGFSIPDDIAIIGYANEKIAKNLTPPLTTVNQHGVTIGKAAAKILIDRLEGKSNKDFVTKIIDTNIVQRASTMKRL